MKWRKRQLWWLFIPFVLCLTLSGFQYSKSSRQQSAIRRIEELGGRVVTTHGDPRWMQWLTGGKSLRIFEQATLVNLSQTDVTDSDLNLLLELQGLQRLNLRGTDITNVGVIQLGKLTGLKALDLSDTTIRGNGLLRLRGLTALEYLYLHGISIDIEERKRLQALMPNCDIDVASTK